MHVKCAQRPVVAVVCHLVTANLKYSCIVGALAVANYVFFLVWQCGAPPVASACDRRPHVTGAASEVRSKDRAAEHRL